MSDTGRGNRSQTAVNYGNVSINIEGKLTWPNAENNEDVNIGTKERQKLYKAAVRNDWKKAQSIYEGTKKYGAVITDKGETALHVAASAGHTKFVRNLVSHMNEEDIKTVMETKFPGNGNTAFHCAVISGKVEIAKAIAKGNNKLLLKELAELRGERNYLPIEFAALKGNKEMVRYLYEPTEKYLQTPPQNIAEADDRALLVLRLIKSDIYDVALKIAPPLLAKQGIAPTGRFEELALNALAKKPLSRYRSASSFTSFMGTQAVESKIALALVEKLWEKIASDDRRVSMLVEGEDEGVNPITEAAKHGNLNFLSILIALYPDILYARDSGGNTIFDHAITNRHIHVFRLIHTGSVKTNVTLFKDTDKMLHLAATLPKQKILDCIPGAALQLQQELMFFEDVKKIIVPSEVNRENSTRIEFQKISVLLKDISTWLEHGNVADIAKEHFRSMENLIREYHEAPISENINIERLRQFFEQFTKTMGKAGLNDGATTSEQGGRGAKLQVVIKKMNNLFQEYERNQKYKFKDQSTPYDYFFEQHQPLMEKGEKWLRDTANSCMIVAALITTLSFAAAITVPGGNSDKDGSPHFLSDIPFKAFSVANTLSMVYSTLSLVVFLSIFTARYTINDFRWSLPNKLLAGLATLLVSICAMMTAFILSTFIIFKNSHPWLPVATAAISSQPAFYFYMYHEEHFLQIFSSTYGVELLRLSPGRL